MPPRVLVVLTSVDKIESTGLPTGWYLPELAHPYHLLAPKTSMVVASPKGGVAPLDPGSVELFKEDKAAMDFFREKKDVWQTTSTISSHLGKASEFDALFYPGGHGPMFDLATNADSIKLIQEFYAAGKPVAAVCHGPAAFVNVTVDGQPLLKGRQVTGFSNAEEDAVQLTDAMPFSLEDRIKKVGGDFVKAAEPWGVKVASDGKVITGQNPASSTALAEELLKVMGISS